MVGGASVLDKTNYEFAGRLPVALDPGPEGLAGPWMPAVSTTPNTPLSPTWTATAGQIFVGALIHRNEERVGHHVAQVLASFVDYVRHSFSQRTWPTHSSASVVESARSKVSINSESVQLRCAARMMPPCRS